MERLASTNSFCLSDSVFPRTTRATYGHENRTITAMTIDNPGLISPWTQPSFVVLHEATMPIEISSCGTASMTSAPLDSVASVQRPKKPASDADERAQKARRGRRRRGRRAARCAHRTSCARRDLDPRRPRRTRRSSSALSEVRSRPSCPSTARSGACPVTRSATGPPKIASRMSTMITTPPTRAALSCLKRAQKS